MSAVFPIVAGDAYLPRDDVEAVADPRAVQPNSLVSPAQGNFMTGSNGVAMRRSGKGRQSAKTGSWLVFLKSDVRC
jgi:hypothetical protein